jgi:hypothetical protein
MTATRASSWVWDHELAAVSAAADAETCYGGAGEVADGPGEQAVRMTATAIPDNAAILRDDLSPPDLSACRMLGLSSDS